MRSISIQIAICLLLAGCEKHTTLPPPPKMAPGQGFSQVGGFGTAKMLRMCSDANLVASTGKLHTFGDAEIVAGTCEIGAIATETMRRGVDPDQTCVAALKAMIGEFQQRFPDHDPSEAIGRC